MDNFLKLVNNRNSLKALVKDFYIDELQKFSSNLEIIIKQRKSKEDELQEKYKQKLQNIEEIKALLIKQGLSVDDLTGDLSNMILKPVKIKKKLPPKYRLIDFDGITHEWTGRGITPKVFQHHFDRGHSKESCLIIENIDL